MSSPASPAETRAFILERLVGDTGEPDHVLDAARAVGERALAAIAQGLEDSLSLSLAFELQSVELARFASARPENDNHAMAVASSASSPDALVLTMDSPAVAVIVSALFGGDPSMAVLPIDRGLSPTETEVASLVFEEIAKAVNGAGARAFEFKLPLPPAITGADMKKHIIRDGPGVRAVFSVSTPAGAGRICLMMPQRVLLKHRGGTGAQDGAAGSAWHARFSEEIMRSSVDLQATMPLATLTLGQIAGFHEGQILELNPDAQSQAHLSARQKTLFVCELGKLGQNYTVRVRHAFDAGQEFIDGLLPV